MRDVCYELEVAGLKRQLPLCPVAADTDIAAFIMFGDVELTKACAKALLEKAPDFDIMITAEAKGIPLLYEMARQAGRNEYIIARKGPKLYMQDILTSQVNSITTKHKQVLCIGRRETDAMRGKQVLIVDDVISTGQSLAALESLVLSAGGHVAGRMAVLAEGEAIGRNDIIYLEELPIFHRDGTPR